MRLRSRALVVSSVTVLISMLVPSAALAVIEPRRPATGATEISAELKAAAVADSSGVVPIFRFYSPILLGHFYTADPAERDRVITQLAGVWDYEGVAYSAFNRQVPGTVPLYRFWSDAYGGHFYTADSGERDTVLSRWSDTWRYEGVAYYVYPAGANARGSTPVYRFWGPDVRHHFYTSSAAERDTVISRWPSVWSYEGEKFGVPTGPPPVEPPPPPGPGDGDGRFTVATYPDTQQEVFDWAGSRFLDRAKWLVAQEGALDLRFVAHTGDVVNWDTPAHEQYVKAEAALDPLEEAGIPYQLSIGNHDTMATGPGGGARDSKRTREYQRTTVTFNQFWKPSDYSALAGTFEPGKVDNTYSTFSAEGAKWLVLNLEFLPRVAVVEWAEQVIASHSRHNVLIHTHSLLDGAADIDAAGNSSTRWQYGDSSPQYMYDRLVTPYANVKVVMSGHTGFAASKVVTTPSGNKVAHLLQTMHSNNNNPVRLSEFNVATGTISTRVFAPEDGSTWDVNTLSGLTFIRG